MPRDLDLMPALVARSRKGNSNQMMLCPYFVSTVLISSLRSIQLVVNLFAVYGVVPIDSKRRERPVAAANFSEEVLNCSKVLTEFSC